MKMEELIQEAEAKGITLVDFEIYEWVHRAGTREQKKIWLENRELPDDLTPEEVERVSDSIFA
jgi:hypothetical protein